MPPTAQVRRTADRRSQPPPPVVGPGDQVLGRFGARAVVSSWSMAEQRAGVGFADVGPSGSGESVSADMRSCPDDSAGCERRRCEWWGVVLAAGCAVESLSGDHGFEEPFVDRDHGMSTTEAVRLATWLRQLSSVSSPWNGQRSWRSLADELSVQATCSSLGHVSLVVSLQPHAWEPQWKASVILRYALGELNNIADELDAWFAV